MTQATSANNSTGSLFGAVSRARPFGGRRRDFGQIRSQNVRTILAVDVGTTKVCTIIAEATSPERGQVIAHSITPSSGITKGNVTDISQAEAAIRRSVSTASRKAATEVSSAYVGITGTHVTFQDRYDRVNWAATKGVITLDDIINVPKSIAAASARSGRHVIHALTRTYTLDGQRGIQNPLGMHTKRLEVESHVISAQPQLLRRLANTVRMSGLDLNALVFQPVASAESVLTEEEKNEGVALVDIGGGTTDLIIFQQGVVQYTSVIPIGGFQFTNDICIAFDATYESAEAAKLGHGTTDVLGTKPEEEVILSIRDREWPRSILRRDIAQLLKDRAVELLRLIRIKMIESGLENTDDFKVVLTGGAAKLPGMENLVMDNLTSDVRIGIPNSRWELPRALQEPEYATSIGLVTWAMKNPGASFEDLSEPEVVREESAKDESGEEASQAPSKRMLERLLRR
jgi:cell division protein FtsA